MRRFWLIPAVTFLACVLAANYVTTKFGMVPVGFGFTATAGTYLAGITFVVRDSVQDTAGRTATLVLIVIGAALSFLVSAPFIALASGVAFLASESADLLIYTPMRRKGYVRAAVASNIVGSVVDTLLFLSVARFGLGAGVVTGQLVGKLTITAVVVALVLFVQATRARVVTA